MAESRQQALQLRAVETKHTVHNRQRNSGPRAAEIKAMDTRFKP